MSFPRPFVPPRVPQWQTLWVGTGGADGGGFVNYTICTLVLSTAGYSAWSGSQIRVTFTPTSAASGNTSISAAWVGPAASSGDAYDMDGTQKQLLFSGGASTTLTQGGASVVSDALTYTFDPTKNLVVAINIGASGGARALAATNTANEYYHSALSEAATTNKTTGYTLASNTSYVVSKIEVFS